MQGVTAAAAGASTSSSKQQ